MLNYHPLDVSSRLSHKPSWQVDSAVFCLRTSSERRAASWGLDGAGLGSSRCLGNGSLLVNCWAVILKVPLCSLIFTSFYLCVCLCVFMCLCECMCTCVYEYCWRPEDSIRYPGFEIVGGWGCPVLVLGPEHQFSGRTASTFNSWSIFPTDPCSLISMWVIQGFLKGGVQSRDPSYPGLWIMD